MGQRWKRIDRAFQRGEDLPPVELYEIGDAYFVVDGHHRVSVARYHDVPTLEAVVAEFHPKRPVARRPIEDNQCSADLTPYRRRNWPGLHQGAC